MRKIDRHTLRVYAFPIIFALFVLLLVLAYAVPLVVQEVSAL